MRFSHFIGWGLVLGLVPLALMAKDLPPVGKRVYIINEDKKFAPGQIRKEMPATQGGTVLRDPLQKARVEKIVTPAPKPVKKMQPVRQSARLKLQPYDIAGKLTRPRVEFDREQIPVQPVEEPLEYNYLEKVLDEVSQDALIR